MSGRPEISETEASALLLAAIKAECDLRMIVYGPRYAAPPDPIKSLEAAVELVADECARGMDR